MPLEANHHAVACRAVVVLPLLYRCHACLRWLSPTHSNSIKQASTTCNTRLQNGL
jgi:hypothetical protein